MAENDDIKFYENLKNEIEKIAMRKIVVKRDFEYLSAHIMDRTGAYISPITLRRFWGELAGGKYNVNPRRYTLDVMARYTGHYSYDKFVKSCSGDENYNSDFLHNDYILPSTLKTGCYIYIFWEPGHYIVAEYLGCEMFSIVESFKSKLSVGDTFQVDVLAQNEQLYLNRLIHKGGAPCRYICGKQGGVKFRITTDYTNIQEKW